MSCWEISKFQKSNKNQHVFLNLQIFKFQISNFNFQLSIFSFQPSYFILFCVVGFGLVFIGEYLRHLQSSVLSTSLSLAHSRHKYMQFLHHYFLDAARLSSASPVSSICMSVCLVILFDVSVWLIISPHTCVFVKFCRHFCKSCFILGYISTLAIFIIIYFLAISLF